MLFTTIDNIKYNILNIFNKIMGSLKAGVVDSRS